MLCLKFDLFWAKTAEKGENAEIFPSFFQNMCFSPKGLVGFFLNDRKGFFRHF